MRKNVCLFTLVLFLPVFLCFGCQKQEQWSFEPLREGSRSFTLKSAHFSCEGTVEVTGCGLCTVSFSSPESLSYLTISENQDELTVNIGEHTDTLDMSGLPDNALLKLLLKSLQVFLYQNLAFEKGETDTVSASAEVLGYNMTATYNADGTLKALRCSDLKLTVALS